MDKPHEESIWTNFTNGVFNTLDFCFKTYFRRPFKNVSQIIVKSPYSYQIRDRLFYSVNDCPKDSFTSRL